MKQKLRRFYERFSGDDHVLIVINADPDAIASAMAVKRLLWRKVPGVTISHVNVISRPDNITMVRLLGVNLVRVEEIDISRFGKFVLVDSQPDHHEGFLPFNFDAIIDHHPDTGAKAPYVDIRPKYGATATILTEYLRAAEIKPAVKLASGLFHAIKTDTSNFERQTLNEDVKAFQFLFRHANMYMVRKIEQAELRLDYLKHFKRALEDMRIRKGRVFVHLGAVSNPDICVLVADFFMRVISVRWSIVSGFWDDKLIIIIRNDGLRKDAGKVARASFALAGSAGGHKNMARAEILRGELGKLVDPEDAKELRRWIVGRIEKQAGK